MQNKPVIYGLEKVADFLETKIENLRKGYRIVTGRELTRHTLDKQELAYCLQGLERLKKIGRWQSVLSLLDKGLNTEGMYTVSEEIPAQKKPAKQCQETPFKTTLDQLVAHVGKGTTKEQLRTLFKLYMFRDLHIDIYGRLSTIDLLIVCKLVDSTGYLMEQGRSLNPAVALSYVQNKGFPSKVCGKNYFKQLNGFCLRQGDAEQLYYLKTGKKLDKSFITVDQLKMFYPLYAEKVAKERNRRQKE